MRRWENNQCIYNKYEGTNVNGRILVEFAIKNNSDYFEQRNVHETIWIFPYKKKQKSIRPYDV